MGGGGGEGWEKQELGYVELAVFTSSKRQLSVNLFRVINWHHNPFDKTNFILFWGPETKHYNLLEP